MTRTNRAMALVGLGTLLASGCGPATTNEEGITNTRAPGAENAPTYSSYGEKMQKDAEIAAKQLAEAKKGKGAARKAEPATPAAPAEAPK
jgi:hypothetical protein